MSKPILCLDFDGVLHSYTSGWQGADVIPDPPIPGALEFLGLALNEFEVHIFSSRSHQQGGIKAMQDWLIKHLHIKYHDPSLGPPSSSFKHDVHEEIHWPTEKPPAFLTIDDRAITFTGVWPAIEDLKNFKPWNKK